MGTNQDYKNRALASLEGKWSTAVIATLIFLVITAGINWTVTAPMGKNMVMSYSTSGIWTLICLPLSWGFVVYVLRLIRNEEIGYGRLFDGYKDFVRIFCTGLSILLPTFRVALCYSARTSATSSPIASSSPISTSGMPKRSQPFPPTTFGSPSHLSTTTPSPVSSKSSWSHCRDNTLFRCELSTKFRIVSSLSRRFVSI